MKLQIITIGKWKSAAVAELVHDYANRIGHYLPFEHSVLKEISRLTDRLDPDTYLVICDERGREMTSVELAKWIESQQNAGVKKLAFLVGDAAGIPEDLKRRGKFSLSLSAFTLPHELAAVVLFEQVYRACTILKGEKYHYG